MEIPPEYEGREQSFLKHRVLEAYLREWSHKIGSLARHGPVRLWYVDCFSGPWESRDEQLSDTSIRRGLEALEEASETWASAGGAGHCISTGAIFVEQRPDAYRQLDAFLRSRKGNVKAIALPGAFGDRVGEICAHLKDDPAFIFVDPTGFKGAAMKFLPPLLRPRMRDVLVNVMFDHMNRFRSILQEHMRDFFNLGDEELPASASEVELFSIYREKLKQTCELSYAADLRIPHPHKDRTWFRLVIGGKSPSVLEVFRRVEARVLGREASDIRELARQRKEHETSGQTNLFSTGPELEPWYMRQNTEDQEHATTRLLELIRERGSPTWGQLWPLLLEEHHVTLSEAKRLALALAAEEALVIERSSKGRLEDQHRLVASPAGRPPSG